MGVVILPNAVRTQLMDGTGKVEKTCQWCQARNDAIHAFEADGQLVGASWSAARVRMGHYKTFFRCLGYGCELVKEANGKVSKKLVSHFGNRVRVDEDAITRQRDEAHREAVSFDSRTSGGACDIPLIGGLFSSYYRGKASQWRSAESAAEQMLEHIRQYTSETASIYDGAIGATRKALLDGAKAFVEAGYDSATGKWGTYDPSWIAGMRKACDSGASTMDDFFDSKGKLRKGKLRDVLTKPPELWTEDEARAVRELYEEAGKRAVGKDTGILCMEPDPSLLEDFLECGYTRTEVIESFGAVEGGERRTVTYRMSDGMQAFLLVYNATMQYKASKTDKPLSQDEYFLSGIGTGLLVSGVEFTRSDFRMTSPSLHEDPFTGGKSQVSPGYPDVEFDIEIDMISDDARVRGKESTGDIMCDHMTLGIDGSERNVYVFRETGSHFGENQSLNANLNGPEALRTQQGIDAAQDSVDSFVEDQVLSILQDAGEDAIETLFEGAIDAIPGGAIAKDVLSTIYDASTDYQQRIDALNSARQLGDEVNIEQWLDNYYHDRGVDHGAVVYADKPNGGHSVSVVSPSKPTR